MTDSDYDIALSFAGEDRAYVEQVAAQLRLAGVRVFYDEYERVSLWGKDLYEHLSNVYLKRSRYTLLFASEHYARKLWPTHERRSAQARALSEGSAYVLPARFDDTEIPGLLPTVHYLDLRTIKPAELAALCLKKLGFVDNEISLLSIRDYLHSDPNVLRLSSIATRIGFNVEPEQATNDLVDLCRVGRIRSMTQLRDDVEFGMPRAIEILDRIFERSDRHWNVTPGFLVSIMLVLVRPRQLAQRALEALEWSSYSAEIVSEEGAWLNRKLPKRRSHRRAT